MGVVGAAIILGLIVAVLVRMHTARLPVALICVLFGLVLGATPIGHSVYSGVAWAGMRTASLLRGL